MQDSRLSRSLTSIAFVRIQTLQYVQH